MRYSLLALLLTAALASTAAATETGAGPRSSLDLAELSQRLSEEAPECVEFQQQRWLADLGTQVDSQGYFQRQSQGFIWQTLTPVNDRVVLTPDNPDLPPGLKAMLPVLSGLLQGDWARLEQHFSIDLKGSIEQWNATLTPTDDIVSERLEQIQLNGADRIDQLHLVFRNGDRLMLELSAAPCPDVIDQGNGEQPGHDASDTQQGHYQ
uniref:LolA-related protein n=1 Tax=Halomonas sp. TaxID=1486246 RepID=UPI00262A3DEA|nr:LolA-related protein [Halomonas sp.]